MNTQYDKVATFLSTWEAAEMSGDASALGEALADDFTAFGPLGFALSKRIGSSGIRLGPCSTRRSRWRSSSIPRMR